MPLPLPRAPRGRSLLLGVITVVLVVTGAVASGATGRWNDRAVAGEAAPADDRPNVVVVMADDMRVDDLLFAPSIRRLVAGRGLSMENAFSPFPLCCPARASFLSGVYAHNHGVYWHERPYGYQAFDDSRTIATSMSDAGYRTGFVGKYLNGYGSDRSRVSGGPSFRYVPDGWSDWAGALEDPGGSARIAGGPYDYYTTDYNVNGRIDRSHRGRYQTNVVGDLSVDLARKYHRADDPFFLYVSYVAPHHGGPVEADDPRARGGRRDGVFDGLKTPARPAQVRGRFDRLVTRPSGLPRGGGPAEADVSDKPSVLRGATEPGRAERAALTEVTRQRAEAISVLDQQVGRLVRTLKETGEWEDTVFVFTSDNGYFLGEHRRRTGKVLAHEPSLRVPLLVTGPGLRERNGKRYDPVSTVDLTATLLDIADAEPPLEADGRSAWGTLRRGDAGWTAPVVTEAVHSTRGRRVVHRFGDGEKRTSIGLRTPRFSFTLYRDGQGELYDLKVDPAQMENKFSDRRYRGVREALVSLWAEYKDCAGDACRTAMPEAFTATARQNRALTRHYWSSIDRRYGHRPQRHRR